MNDATKPGLTKTVKLTRPIPFMDTTKDELVFREPTGKDVAEIGDPVWMDNEGKLDWNEAKMTAHMARLSDTPIGSIHKMRAGDWKQCAWALTTFFLPEAPEATTTS